MSHDDAGITTRYHYSFYHVIMFVGSLADFVLPSNWTKCCGDGSTIFSKVQPNSLRGSVVTHTLTIQTDNTMDNTCTGKGGEYQPVFCVERILSNCA